MAKTLDTINLNEQRLMKAPRAAEVAGILFGVLFAICLVLLRSAMPVGITPNLDWLETGATQITAAIILMPFAGITFLWFIGVLRDRFGALEDRFFATVFLGSGLLFLAMVFVAMALAGGILSYYRLDSELARQGEAIFFGRAVMLQISNVYALRMAGVFMISLGTIWLRTALMPRWLVVLTYLGALVLLLVVNLSLWITLVFPAWVALISLYSLLALPARSYNNDG
jgi:hypothetical protein